MEWYGKFLVGIGIGFMVFTGALTLWAILEHFGFPVASAEQVSAQMLYFMLTGWGVVAFVNHLQKGLHKRWRTLSGPRASGRGRRNANKTTRTSTRNWRSSTGNICSKSKQPSERSNEHIHP